MWDNYEKRPPVLLTENGNEEQNSNQKQEEVLLLQKHNMTEKCSNYQRLMISGHKKTRNVKSLNVRESPGNSLLGTRIVILVPIHKLL